MRSALFLAVCGGLCEVLGMRYAFADASGSDEVEMRHVAGAKDFETEIDRESG